MKEFCIPLFLFAIIQSIDTSSLILDRASEYCDNVDFEHNSTISSQNTIINLISSGFNSTFNTYLQSFHHPTYHTLITKLVPYGIPWALILGVLLLTFLMLCCLNFCGCCCFCGCRSLDVEEQCPTKKIILYILITSCTIVIAISCILSISYSTLMPKALQKTRCAISLATQEFI